MTRNPSPPANGQDPTAKAAKLVQELLDRVIQTTQVNNAKANSPLPGTALADTLRRLIVTVRAEYQLLADREIALALEAALGIETAMVSHEENAAAEPAPSTAAFDALEALISGVEFAPHAGHDHSAVPLVISESLPIPEPEEALFEGTVRLYVNAQGNMQRVIRFVDDIGQRPQFRVLRMTGNPQREGAEIDLGLREPTAFVELLRSMGHAAEAIDASGDGVPHIAVQLRGTVAA